MKMTNEIRIKMAEAEGFVIGAFDMGTQWWDHPATRRVGINLPTYDNDNDLDRFIRGMDDDEVYLYHMHLKCVTGHPFAGCKLHQATEDQKQEAIVKAKGWEDDTDGE